MVERESGRERSLHRRQADYARGSVKLAQGDLLACCTDGILQVSDEREEVYGAKRLADFIRSHRDRNAQGIVDAVLAEVSSYSTASMNDDDKVLIVMKVTADKSGEPMEEGKSG